MRVEVFRTLQDLGRIEEQWRGILLESAVSTPFQHIEFQRTWWQHFGQGELCLLAVHNNDVLVGLVSMYVDEDAVLRWVGGEDIADYLDVIASPAEASAVRRVVFEWLSGVDAPNWIRAHLANIPERSESAGHWQELASDRGWYSESVFQDVCPQFILPDGFDLYLDGLEGKQRREIRRKLRRAAAEDARVVFIDPGEKNPLLIDKFISLMQASGLEKAEFLTPRMRGALGDILRATQDAGMLGMCFLEVEGSLLAAYAYFSMGGVVYLYNSGYNPGMYASLSPGWVLLGHLIEHVIASGHTYFDFMRGDEDYKYWFGGEDERVLLLRISR